MDIIYFELNNYDSENWDKVITFINGRKFSQYVSGGYGDGIRPGWLYYELKGGCFYGGRRKVSTEPYLPYISGFEPYYWNIACEDEKESINEPKCAAVLGCSCGVDGCDQYLVRITETRNSIIWDDYSHVSRYRQNLLHFEFVKKQYFKEVEKLVELTIKTGILAGLPMEVINDLKGKGQEIFY